MPFFFTFVLILLLYLQLPKVGAFISMIDGHAVMAQPEHKCLQLRRCQHLYRCTSKTSTFVLVKLTRKRPVKTLLRPTKTAKKTAEVTGSPASRETKYAIAKYQQ